MNDWYNFYKTGLEKEYEFCDSLIKNCGGSCKHSSRKEDIFDHIDIIWTLNNKKYTFDVKALKKTNRSDSFSDDSIHWVELQNVLGKPGWLYGKANYIVFELKKCWIVIQRKKLITLIKNKVINKKISNSKKLYTFYQRLNRNDIIVKVLTKDLIKISGKILIK